MLNKFLHYIVLVFITVPLFAQDSITYTDSLAMLQDTVFETAPPKMAVNSPVYSKRSFKTDFKEKYSDADFKYETKAVTKTWWDRFLEWLDSLFGNKSGNASNVNWVDLFLYTVAFLVMGGVIYLIVRSVLNKESIWIFGRSRKKIHVQDAEAENIHVMDFKQLVEDTKATGNYRLALRYYYLWLLKKLSAREIIDWHWDKTNSDYLYEIKDNNLRKNFEYLSYVYDHSWYGDFPIDETAFVKAERSFKKTINTL